MIVTQTWTHDLKLMQQTVLLTAIRGPDGIPKYHPVKFLLRWYRRCVLLSAIDKNVWLDPYSRGGGSFTGPSYVVNGTPKQDWEIDMNLIVGDYLRSLDELPHHFQLHFLHAVEIIGYKHPDQRIREWWHTVYLTLVNDMHLNPETEKQLDYRLSDSEKQWRSTNHEATQE